ncbi:hypothetical protein A9Q93_07405, partial [Nonlabens dokdonensis]
MKNYTRFLFSLFLITFVYYDVSGKSEEVEVNKNSLIEASIKEHFDGSLGFIAKESSAITSTFISSIHSEIPGLDLSNFYAPQTFSGLGAADSGGTGFKTINNIAELVVSNNLNHDFTVLYGSDESFSGGTEVLTIQADNVDAESFDLNDIRIANFTGSSTYTGTTIQYFDKDDNSVGSMTISGTLTTAETSVNPLFSGDDLPILGVAKIVFTVTGGGPPANFEIRSIDFTSPVVPTPCSDPDIPTLTSAPTTVCTGSSATINIAGNLNDATAWHIYTGSCGGTPLGTTTTSSFNIPTISAATTYYVRGEGGCVTPGSCGSITITPTAIDDASFSYSASSYCVNASDPSPTITGLGGGSFSSTAGLSVNASSGTIDVSASTPGTYTVTYTTTGSCPNSSNVSVTINALDDASFSYSSSIYSTIDADPTPTITGVTGGSFSSTSGLSLNASSGLIDLSVSTPGSYNVTYTTSGACPNSFIQSLTIVESNDNLSGATSLTYGAGCTGSIYDIANATLEMGESVPDCAFDTGAPVVPANRSSQWYSFIASGSGDALIKITDNGINNFGPQSASIALTLALYEAPSVAGDVSTLSTPVACSSSSTASGVELLDGTFIDAKGLTPGSTYYVQVYSNENTTISYCIDVSEPVIYTFNNGWQAPNGDPELVNNPFKRVEIVAGNAVQQPLTNGSSPIPPSVGSLYVAQNASVSYDYLLLNYKMEIDGALNPVIGPSPDPTFPAFITTNQSLTSVAGMGNANVNSLIYVNENANNNTANVDLDIDVYYELQTSDRPLSFSKKVTLKSTADRTAVFTSQSFTSGTSTNGNISGLVEIEQFVPENNSVRGRAYRFVSSPVASMSTIYSQWQENGAAPSGFGTHITGASGTVGMVDAATGFDQTSSG